MLLWGHLQKNCREPSGFPSSRTALLSPASWKAFLRPGGGGGSGHGCGAYADRGLRFVATPRLRLGVVHSSLSLRICCEAQRCVTGIALGLLACV